MTGEDGVDEGLVAALREGLAAHADPGRAEQQQRYMKSKLPYRGLPSPLVAQVCRRAFAASPLTTRDAWRTTALALWDGAAYREEWYAAIALLRHRPYAAWAHDPAMLPTYGHLIATGAWWDVVDDVASHLVGDLLRAEPLSVAPSLRQWATADDPWLRRTALICQIGSGLRTDTDLLAYALTSNLAETGFFLRKAVGWALRAYGASDPDWVREYVAVHGHAMSGLSLREARKHLTP